MRISLKEILDNLGVGYVMGPYETCPWSVYDGEKGLTCNAEARMNEDASLLEAEVMLIHDVPPAGATPIEIIFRLQIKPSAGKDLWEACSLIIKGADKTNGFYDWEKKACNFFNACVQELKMNAVPDIEALMKEHLSEEGDPHSAGRGGSSKAPKIKPQSLLGMKGGRGF